MRMRAEDRESVERVLSGDGAAFETLVRKYNRLGGAIAFGVLGDFQLAEDAVQDAFVKAFRSLGGLKDPRKFRVWFSGIVRKQAIDVYRQRRTTIQRASSLDVDERTSGESGSETSSCSAVIAEMEKRTLCGAQLLARRFGVADCS